MFQNVIYSCDGKAEFSLLILICWFGAQLWLVNTGA